MRKLSSHLLGIDQGDEVLFSDFDNEGEMWAGSGPREVRVPITFSETYDETPAVTLGLSMWDMSNQTFFRVDVRAEDITAEGFSIVFRTWADTKIARVRVAWQSIGPLSGEDSWDI